MTRGLEADWRNFFFFFFFSDKFQFPEVGRAIFLISKAGKFCKLKLNLEETSVNFKDFPLFECDTLLRVDDDTQNRGCQDLYSLSSTHGLQGLSSG